MIKHTLKILWNERKHNIVITLELLLIAVVLWCVVDVVYCTLRNYYSPTGFDIENTFVMHLQELPEGHAEYIEDIEYEDKVDNVYTIFNRLKQIPGVEVASLSIASRPGSPGNIGGAILTHRGSITYGVFTRFVTPEFIDVYKYEPHNSTREHLRQVLLNGNIIISRDAERFIIGDEGTLVGDTTFMDIDLEQIAGVIGGVVEPVRYSQFDPVSPFSLIPLTDMRMVLEYNWFTGLEFSMRVTPETTATFHDTFVQDIAPTLSAGNYRFGELLYVPDQFDGYITAMENEFITQSLLTLFLLVNVLLGITGVFWFRTVKRRSEIGLRIALGSAPSQAVRQFLLEGTLMLIIAMILTMIIMAVVFQFELLSQAVIPLDTKRYFEVCIITTLLMHGIVILAVWLPTRKARRVGPAVALKEN